MNIVLVRKLWKLGAGVEEIVDAVGVHEDRVRYWIDVWTEWSENPNIVKGYN
jgi:hypothetical protein